MMMEQIQEIVDKLIIHGVILAMDDETQIIEDGAIGIIGSKIAFVGKTKDLLRICDPKEIIDAKGQIVMPGLINAHSHAPATFLRGYAENLRLQDWLEKVWKAERKIVSPKTVEAGARLAYLEMIQGGITTSLDMWFFPEISALTAKEVGFRLMSGPIYIDYPFVPDGISMDQRTIRAREFLEEYQNDTLIVPSVNPHSTYTVVPEYLVQAKQLADEFAVPFCTHASENDSEVNQVMKRYQKSPIGLLESLGLLDERTVLFHCVCLSDEDINFIANRRSVVVHNVVCNLKIGSGIAPLPKMKTAGIPILLGTDGPQSNNDFNMWLTIRLAAILHNGVTKDPTFLPAIDAIKMVTCDAAKALGLGDRIGSIEVGKSADIIFMDFHKPHLVPIYDYYAHLAYAAGREDVSTVLINGKIVMRDRNMLTMDAEKAIADIIEIGKEVKNTV